MDGLAPTVVGRSPPTNHGEEERAHTPFLNRVAPNNEAHTADGVPSVRESLQEQGVSAVGADINLASWKPGTEKQYRSHIRRWTQFCNIRDIDPIIPVFPR